MTLYEEALDHAIHWADEAADRAYSEVGMHYATLSQAWALIAIAAKDTDRAGRSD